MSDYKIEVCLESVESVKRSKNAGADRVELCSDLFQGGLTPSLGTVRRAKKVGIPLSCMIRPRGGDFCYTDEEFEVMKEDLLAFKQEGVYSVVFGILNADGSVDKKRCRELLELARPMRVTFHRAFDMSRNLSEALEDIISLGFDRILTSGGEASVMEGLLMLEKLIRQAGDRIIIMPGAGIKSRNFEYISSHLDAKEYHVHPTEALESEMIYRPSHIFMGGVLRESEYSRVEVSESGLAFFTSRKR